MSRRHDLLLSWLGTLGRASHAAARRAAESVETDPAALRWALDRGLGELRRAGHVERGRTHWSVVPTTLIWRRTRGELYGARDELLAESLTSRGLGLTRVAIDQGPEIWRLTGDRRVAEGICEELGIRFGDDRGEEWLAALPTARAALLAVAPLARQHALIGRFWQRFRVPGRWGPEKSHDRLTTGLWRSRSPQPYVYLWSEADGSYRRLDRAEHRLLARWAVIAPETCLKLEPDGLQVPLHLRLPVLVDRALRVAAGGEVHVRSNARWYPGIDDAQAVEAARILGTRLKRRP